LLDINRRFLMHDYYTDIITFPTDQNDRICGELYISVERVKENSKLLKALYTDELHRVIIHGILHLLGYKDTRPDQKKEMRFVENKWLNLRPVQLIG
jgi:rRNA maturation RNase YbeY